MVILQSHCTDRPIENGQLSRDRGELVSLRNSVKESRAESDFDYLRMRALKELSAAASGRDIRVRRVHLEMAKRYQALLSGASVLQEKNEARLHAADQMFNSTPPLSCGSQF